MRYPILFFIFLIVLGCKSDKTSEVNLEAIKLQKKQVNGFINELTIDSTLKRLGKISELTLSNGDRKESILAICSCEKDKNDNSIKIQLSSGIPTRKELDSLGITDKTSSRFNNLFGFGIGNLEKINGQFKFLTFSIKDSVVINLALYSKSTGFEYNGKDFESVDISKHKIKISTFDYSTASNVYGDFELIFPEGYGYFVNDSIVKGHFECNNWRINSKEEIQNWDIHKWYIERKKNGGFIIN